jgi:carboxyl-terminal processing protease
MQFQGEQNGSTAMKKKPCIVVLVITFLLISCSQPVATPSTVPSTPTTVPTHTPQVVANEEYLSTFETVWQTVNDKYFDPTFGGLDWSEVHERYQPLIAAAENDNEFYERLNVMLFELNVSHIGVVPPDDLQQIDPVLSAEGSSGIDVRLIDGNAVITFVEPGSPGAQAGLRPGFVIQSIDGSTIEQISKKTVLIPPLHDRNKRKRITDAILKHLYGSPETTASIVYLDEQGETHTESIVRASRAGRVVLDDTLPPFFIDFEAKRLDSHIGYIRFNAFVPPVEQKFPEAIESMSDTSALIIDLRGNHGGVFFVRKALAEKLVGERTLFWRYERRDGTKEVYLEPAENVYEGLVVVLIDVLSISSAEEFSGGLQAIGRAVIVGERSPGIVVVAEVTQLPNGATFLYPIERTMTADGSVLEGNGVTPDIEVAVDRSLLLQGIDAQLEAAVRHIEDELQK